MVRDYTNTESEVEVVGEGRRKRKNDWRADEEVMMDFLSKLLLHSSGHLKSTQKLEARRSLIGRDFLGQKVFSRAQKVFLTAQNLSANQRVS